MNNPTTAELIKWLRGITVFLTPYSETMLGATADRLEALEQELIDERYRHDRLQDFCVEQGAELSEIKARQRWIPVTVRLPEEDGKYFVTCSAFGATWMSVLCFAEVGEDVDDYDLRGKRNVWYEYDTEYGYVHSTSITHWMPLPELPVED